MNPPARRKSIALLTCCGITCALAGTYAAPAQAQGATSLRVDPALLGLPPLEAPPAVAPKPESTSTSSAASAAESLPVAAPVVETPAAETPPVEPAQSDARVAPQAERPQALSSDVKRVESAAVEPAVEPVLPKSQAARPSLEQAAVPVRPQPPATLVRRAAPAATSRSTSAATASAAEPLRVDPALLGLPPAGAPAPVAQSATTVTTARRGEKVTRLAQASRSSSASAAGSKSWFSPIWDAPAGAWNNGDWELYLPLHTHHLRSAYTAEKIASYQENPLGFGLGSGLYNEHGNWEGVYGMAFQDSHFKPMYLAGYGWKAIWRPAEDVRLGFGYTAGLMSRTDIFHYVPFPVLLPIASVAYKNFSLEGTFVPGGKGNGNIFFIWAKWELGKNGEAIGTPARPQPIVDETLLAADQSRASGASGASVLTDQRVPFGPRIAQSTVQAGAGAAFAEDAQPSSRAGSGETSGPGSIVSATPAEVGTGEQPTFLSSLRMAGSVDREFIAEGDAELRKADTLVNAERMTYWPIDDEVEAEGEVRLEQGGDVISGPKMRLRLDDRVGFFEEPEYVLKRQPATAKQTSAEKAYAETYAGLQQQNAGLTSGFAVPPSAREQKDSLRQATEAHGVADRIDFEGENQIQLTNATYSTCAPGNDDWYAKTSAMHLDYDREVGEGRNGTVYFKDVPIFYTPWLTFSLNNQRKSGLLAPSFGTNSKSGIEFSLPYYWNIAPNMDATITPRIISKRGLQLNNDFRYLNTAYGGLYQGEVKAEFLPGDRLQDGDNRYGVSLIHTQAMANGFSGSINFNKVSDDDYFTDLSSGVTATAKTQLLQQGVLSYGGGGWWNATANFQQYQTLQPDKKVPVVEPYRMLPQLTVNARKPDLYGADGIFLGQYTNFSKANQVISGVSVADPDGQRTVLYPQLALPIVTPGWYVTPKVGVNVRHYSLSGQAAGVPDTINVTTPVFSVDSGMTFERPSNWFGRDYTQTLEPRLYYLNIPYKDQGNIPIFDSASADFNFAQIFSENQFSGWDRLNNANQLTAAVTSRLLDPKNGDEIMRAMLGQRFYFEANKVGLGTSPLVVSDDGKWQKSDILAAFSGQVLPKVTADTALQYNIVDSRIKRYSLGLRYTPQPGKVLNASYRYNRDTTAPIDQIDLSGQWPLTGQWYAVGRVNYSLKDDATNINNTTQGGRIIESIAGLEYNGGCWVARGVVQQTALTQDSKSTAFFIQLELNGFGQVGSNPLNLLKRNIQGYSPINQPIDATNGVGFRE